MAPSPLLVTAAVLHHAGKVLIAQRLDTSAIEPGKWEFPGGKVRWGEDPRQCLMREVEEELALRITIGDIFCVSSHVYNKSLPSEVHVVLLVYLATYGGGNHVLRECKNAVWVCPHELPKYSFAAADIPICTRIETQSFLF